MGDRRDANAAAAARDAIVQELLGDLGAGAARAWRERLTAARRRAGRRLAQGAPQDEAALLRRSAAALDAGALLLTDFQAEAARRSGLTGGGRHAGQHGGTGS